MKYKLLVLVLVTFGILVSPVLANESVIYENSFKTSIYFDKTMLLPTNQTLYLDNPWGLKYLLFWKGDLLKGMEYMDFLYSGPAGYYGDNMTLIPAGRYYTTYTCFGQTNDAIIDIVRYYYVNGSISRTSISITLKNLDYAILGHETLGGSIEFNNFDFVKESGLVYRITPPDANNWLIQAEYAGSDIYYRSDMLLSFAYGGSRNWKNDLVITKDDDMYRINLQRCYDSITYLSNITCYNGSDIIYFDNTNANIRYRYTDYKLVDKIQISSKPGGFSAEWVSNINYGTGEPLPPGGPFLNKTFTVFVRDGNTYEPITESVVAFKNYNTGEWTVNKTVYNGYASITMPYGWYYAYVNANGYYQPQPMQLSVDDNLVSATFNIYQIGEIPEPEEPTDFLDLTVSVKNSQTGALIGGSEIGIRKYGDTGFYYNTTLPSGYTTVFLPPGNYEIFAEAPGYYQVYPARITLDQPHEKIGVFLHPITPIPEEGNVTLNLWVCYVERGSGQTVGIPYADILISGISGDGIGYSSGSLMTDLGGYISIDIPANTEYIAYAEKPGYLAGTTHFTVYNVSPVNMTIQMIREIPPTVPVVTPPPTIPTLPTPTEPLGFMEQSGKALGDLFGVSLSTGKMMLGVLISLAVGMGTAKNLKGGAPEFCVGFLGAAFLVTMADLIPVGFFVAMLLLMGIYIARAYFLGGENGG